MILKRSWLFLYLYTNSQINVGGNTTFDIGRDVNIKGGVINTGRAQGAVGGDVNIESLQDTATYDSKQKNMGFNADIDIAGGGAGSSLSVNGGKTNLNADYKGVGEQSGIFTGDGGLDLTAGGKTTLIGGAITTTEAARDAGRNNYESLGGITTQDIENTTSYDGDAIQVGVSLGMTENKPQANSNGIGYGTDSDSDSSITRAGITGIAGNKDITTDNRAEYAGILENSFDAGQVNEELSAQVEITQAFDQERRKVKNEINAKEKKLRDEAEEQDKLGNTIARDTLLQQADKVQNQGLLFDAISGAIYGPNSNGATGYAAKAASPFVANQIGNYFKANEVVNSIDGGDRSEQGSAAHLLAHSILGAAVSYATGNDILTGGLSASSGELTAPILSKFLYDVDKPSELTPEQKDTISAITSAVGLTIGATTGSASDAANAAETSKVAVEDNYLSESQDRSYSVLGKSTDFLRNKSKENEDYLVKICEASPSSKACQTAIQDSLWYNSESALRKRIADGDASSKRVLNILYNGKNAEDNFLSRVPDIDSRANFFGTNDNYYDGKGVDVRWFGGADEVSRSCITGLGADGCFSYITFGASKILGNPDIYGWRGEAGNTLIKDGYSNFKSLYNGQYDPCCQSRRTKLGIFNSYVENKKVSNPYMKNISRITHYLEMLVRRFQMWTS